MVAVLIGLLVVTLLLIWIVDYVQGNTTGNTEVDGKSPDGKEKLPIKRSKGSLGSLNMITGKKNEQNKAAANGGYPKRYSDRIMKL